MKSGVVADAGWSCRLLPAAIVSVRCGSYYGPLPLQRALADQKVQRWGVVGGEDVRAPARKRTGEGPPADRGLARKCFLGEADGECRGGASSWARLGATNGRCGRGEGC